MLDGDAGRDIRLRVTDHDRKLLSRRVQGVVDFGVVEVDRVVFAAHVAPVRVRLRAQVHARAFAANAQLRRIAGVAHGLYAA